MLSCTVAQAAELNFKQQEFQLPIETENLVVADLNGDGLLELLAVVENGLQIYFQTESGFDFDSNNSIEFPGQVHWLGSKHAVRRYWQHCDHRADRRQGSLSLVSRRSNTARAADHQIKPEWLFEQGREPSAFFKRHKWR